MLTKTLYSFLSFNQCRTTVLSDQTYKFLMFWLLRAFFIFWERFADICAAINSRRGIVRFLFANLVLLVIKPWLILFGWYVTSYATVHTPLILASLKRCMSIFVMVSLILIDLGISILMFRTLTHSTYLFSISWGIWLSHCIFKSQRLWNSILPINNTGDINPNGLYILISFSQMWDLCRYLYSECVFLFISIQAKYFSLIRFCFEMFFCKI